MRTTFILLTWTLGLQTLSALDWPQWRGPNRDGVSKETGLLKSWPAAGPARAWIFSNAGAGYSSFSIANGKLYTMGSRRGTEQLICLDARTGQEQWAANIGPELKNKWGGGPRGTPSVDGTRIYAMGGQGNLICTDLNGRIQWQTSMNRLGGKTPGWGYTESVLVDGNLVIATPGGSQGAVAAFNKQTGQVAWRSEQFKDGAQYSSVIAVNHNGARQYIQLTQQNVVGLDARNGNVLWKSSWPGRTAVVPTPIFSNGNVYISSGYGVGCKVVNIGASNRVRDVWQNKVMQNHHGGVIQLGQHVYGFGDGRGLVCQKLSNGEEVWTGDRSLRKGAITIADGMIIAVNESDGTVALAPATPNGFRMAGKFRLQPQSSIRSRSGKVWTHPVVANGRLYLRDQEHIYCHFVGSNGPGGVGISSGPSKPAGHVGKTRPWTASVNNTSIDFVYKGKTKDVVEQVFGKADKTQGGWLGYTGMNVKGPQGEAYTTVWFGIANGVVQQVRFDK